jgi:hypothetical protein
VLVSHAQNAAFAVNRLNREVRGRYPPPRFTWRPPGEPTGQSSTTCPSASTSSPPTPSSVVDAVRMRGRVGTDVAYEALRRYLRRPGASPGDLLRLARRLRAGGPMSDALEVLTG